jgi:hypothetical protein
MPRTGNPNWKPGVSGNPKGKPVGAKDKKWARLDWWFEKIEPDWERLDPEKRVAFVAEFVKMLIPRRTLPPETPGDSKENADIRLAEILRAEGRLDVAKPGIGKDLLADRKAEIQVSSGSVVVPAGVGSVEAEGA